MATNPSTLPENSGRITGVSTNYPRGSAKNDTTGTTGDGTPIKQGFMDDIYGPQQALLRAAGLAPSGSSDTAVLSQYVQAMTQLAAGRAVAYDDSGVVNAYVMNIRANQQMPAAIFPGMTVRFKPLADNTGPSTIDVSALTGAAEGTTVLPILDTAGDPLAAGAITGCATLLYDENLVAFVVDGVAASRFDAIEATVDGFVVPNFLSGNQNCNVPSSTGTLPTAVAQDVTAGEYYAYDYLAVTDITNLTRVGGLTDADSGITRRTYGGDFASLTHFGVQLADGTVSQDGCTLTYDATSNETWLDIDHEDAPAFYCPVLSPAKSGPVAVINDSDSLAPTYNELMRNRTRTNVNGTSEGAMGVVYTNNLPIPIYISMSTYGSISIEAFALLVDGIYVAASFESAAVAGGMAVWVGSEVLPGETYQFVDNDNRRDNVMITK